MYIYIYLLHFWYMHKVVPSWVPVVSHTFFQHGCMSYGKNAIDKPTYLQINLINGVFQSVWVVLLVVLVIIVICDNTANQGVVRVEH